MVGAGPRPALSWAAVLAVLLACTLALHPGTAAARAPSISAPAAIVIDARTGERIYARSADSRRSIASTTKLMTAYVVFGALKAKTIRLDQQVNVSENAWRMVKSGSAMFIEPRKPFWRITPAKCRKRLNCF